MGRSAQGRLEDKEAERAAHRDQRQEKEEEGFLEK